MVIPFNYQLAISTIKGSFLTWTILMKKFFDTLRLCYSVFGSGDRNYFMEGKSFDRFNMTEWICHRGLHSRARYQTRRDRTRLETIPEWPGRDYFFMVPLLGKIREKFGTGRDYSVPLGKSLEWYWNNWTWPKRSHWRTLTFLNMTEIVWQRRTWTVILVIFNRSSSSS